MSTSAQKIILRGEIQRQFALKHIAGLNLDKVWEITVKPWRKPRSLDQNSMLHGHCAIIARETGNSPEDVKDALKSMFLPARFIDLDGRQVEVRQSTADLNTVEMAALCEKIMAWAASELGIILPTTRDFQDGA